MLSNQIRNRPLLALALVGMATAGVSLAQERPATISADQRAFEKMAAYLSKGSGKWIGDNLRHDPDQERSPHAFGLLFNSVAGYKLLEIKIEAYLRDEVRESARGGFVWHPGKRDVVYTTISPTGIFMEGTSWFPDDITFVTVSDIIWPDGTKSVHKDENFIVSEDVHKTISYMMDERGAWVRQGENTWKRVPE